MDAQPTYHQQELKRQLQWYDCTSEEVIAELDALHTGEIEHTKLELPLHIWYAAKEVIWERDGLYQ